MLVLIFTGLNSDRCIEHTSSVVTYHYEDSIVYQCCWYFIRGTAFGMKHCGHDKLIGSAVVNYNDDSIMTDTLVLG